MTVEQREKIQNAIQALLDVESMLHHLGGDGKAAILEVETKLHEARTALVGLNAPDYN
jgi:hypothetical protein